jgi:hypothetical protein
MKVSDKQMFKKPYEKPLVTRVRLKVEQNVLQGCNQELPNMSGSEKVLCYSLLECEVIGPG